MQKNGNCFKSAVGSKKSPHNILTLYVLQFRMICYTKTLPRNFPTYRYSYLLSYEQLGTKENFLPITGTDEGGRRNPECGELL